MADPVVQTLQASILSNLTLTISLIKKLSALGVLSKQNVSDITDDALFTVEKIQAANPTELSGIYEQARSFLEDALPDFRQAP